MAGANGATRFHSAAHADAGWIHRWHDADADDATDATSRSTAFSAADDDDATVVFAAAHGGSSGSRTDGTTDIWIRASTSHADDHGEPTNVFRAATTHDAAATTPFTRYSNARVVSQKKPIGTE